MSQRFCCLWPRFGPYHITRVKAATAVFQEHGVEVIGLETASKDVVYEWRVEEGELPIRRERVFPGRVFEEIPPPEMYAGVTAALDRLDPDGVGIMSYGYPDARAALAWCRRHRRVAVNMMAGNEHDAPRVAWRERVKSVILQQYDAALVGGTSHEAYLTKLGYDPAYIFRTYNVIDNAHFRRGAEAARSHPENVRHLPGLQEGSPFFLASNRFTPIKNLSRLLTAYAAYRQRVEEPWRLVLLGDGPLRPELEAQVQREGIEGVEFAGFQQIEDLPAYYGLASAFVHPTLKDTWGVVVNEAMVAALPVIVSRAAGCVPDLVIEGETGFSFDPEDPARLAALLERMADPETDRAAMGERGQRLVEEHFAPEQFGRGLWSAFEAGGRRADRPFSPAGRLVLEAVRLGSRSVHSFHTAEL